MTWEAGHLDYVGNWSLDSWGVLRLHLRFLPPKQGDYHDVIRLARFSDGVISGTVDAGCLPFSMWRKR